MSLPKQKVGTIEDIYDLADGERAELVDGKLFAGPDNKRYWEPRDGLLCQTCLV